MVQSESLETVVVFDLDDTLYKEIDYQTSGFNAVCAWISDVYGLFLWADLESLRQSKTQDILGELCRGAGFQPSVKETLLWVYRLHQPAIKLMPGVVDFLNELKVNWRAAILTDGRSISQRLKIKALGLQHLPIYISEEHSSEKPAPARFELIMHELPASRYVYVGDNLRKDFFAPNALGWTTVCLRDDGRNIHPQMRQEKLLGGEPDLWIDSFAQLKILLC